MQFTAKAFTQWLVLAALVFGAAWFGAQMAVKFNFHQVPSHSMKFYQIEEPPRPCPDC